MPRWLANTCLVWGVAALFGSGACLAVGLSAGIELPAEESLIHVNGSATSITRKSGLVLLRFQGDPRTFAYDAKGGGATEVWSALTQDRTKPIDLAAGSRRIDPLFGDPFYRVYAIASGGRPVRDYEQVRDAWIANDRVALALVPVLLGMGVFLLRLRFRASRAA